MKKEKKKKINRKTKKRLITHFHSQILQSESKFECFLSLSLSVSIPLNSYTIRVKTRHS